jgi:hypothetical protein
MALEARWRSAARRGRRAWEAPRPSALAKNEPAACDIRVTETSLKLSGVVAFDGAGAA